MNLNVQWVHFLERPGGDDPRVRKTLRFLGRKGYLHCELPIDCRGLTLDDVLWVGANVAPELYEVVPAAVLRFPRTLGGARPADLGATLAALRADVPEGPAFRGHPYHRLRVWARHQPRDRRVAKTRRIALRLPTAAADRLIEGARARGLTPDDVVRFALDDYLG